MRQTTLCVWALLAVLATNSHVSVSGSGRQATAEAPPSSNCSLTWIGRETAIVDNMKALLIRRDRMAAVIKSMVAKRGDQGVFYD